MIAADSFDFGVQWSHGDEMPISMRPSDDKTMLLLSPTFAGSFKIVRRVANLVPSKPPNASTRPVDATYKASWYQSSPSGVCNAGTTSTGRAPFLLTTYKPSWPVSV